MTRSWFASNYPPLTILTGKHACLCLYLAYQQLFAFYPAVLYCAVQLAKRKLARSEFQNQCQNAQFFLSRTSSDLIAGLVVCQSYKIQKEIFKRKSFLNVLITSLFNSNRLKEIGTLLLNTMLFFFFLLYYQIFVNFFFFQQSTYSLTNITLGHLLLMVTNMPFIRSFLRTH